MNNITRRNFLKDLGILGTVGTVCPAAMASLDNAEVAQTSAAMTNVGGPGSHAASLQYILDIVHNNPGEPLFITKYNQTAFLKSWGYTGQCPKFFLQSAITYDRFDPTLMPEGSQPRAWSVKMGTFIDGRLDEAKASGMPVYPFTDMLVVPKTLLDKYGDQMRIKKRLSILQPMTQKVAREQLAEIFDRFPGLAGITTRFGETYLQDTPYHAGGSPVSTIEEHTAFIQLLRDEICVKRNKVLIYRTWSWGGIELHTNPASYLSVTNAIEPHPNLFFSIKHANADFIRGVPFNETLGIGNHRQIVEVSSNQGGLYGKNSHPYYIGQGVIEGWEEMEHKKGLRDLIGSTQLAGVWTWSRGDGWGGPYITNEFWVDLNEYVISHFGQEPWRTEEDLFDEYARARLKLDAGQTAKFRELCLVATSATFHGKQSSLFTVCPWWCNDVAVWWCRDQYLTAPNLDIVVAQGLVKDVLAEKAKAVADWKHVEALSHEIQLSNPADQEFLEVSSTYGRIKIAIMGQIWTMQLLAAQEKADGKLDVAAMKQAIGNYDRLWNEWHQLKQAHSCCPTLYKDDVVVAHGPPPFKSALDEYRKKVSQA